MLPEAYASHQIEGRARIQVPSKRRDSAFFDRAVQVLRELEGIEYVYANPLTASILLLHRLSLDEVGDHARRSDLFNLMEPELAAATVIEQAAAGLRVAGRRMQTLTRGNLDLNSALFLGLAAAGLVQLTRKRVWPPALTLMWYAFGLANRK